MTDHLPATAAFVARKHAEQGPGDFVLDLAENPHPRMLAEAVAARDDAAVTNFDPWDPATSYWRGFLAAMSAATGETPDDIEAWMDRAVSRDVKRPEGV